jgi:hypothetical protein
VDLMRARHRLLELLLRHGVRFDDGSAWTQRHRDWLATVKLGWPAAQATCSTPRARSTRSCTAANPGDRLASRFRVLR